MRTKKIFCILLALAMLMLSISPLAARNTPYVQPKDQPIAHPWQDDNQTEPLPDPVTRVVINFGGIFIGFDLPNFLVPAGTKPAAASLPKADTGTYRSASKIDRRGINDVMTPKGM